MRSRTIRGLALVFAGLIGLFAGARVASAETAYKVERLVRGSDFHGVHGIAFDSKDRLFVGSVVGQSIYEVNARNGKVRTVVPPPEGMADDIAFAKDDTMVWTAFLLGTVYARKGNEAPRAIATGLPGVNSLNFSKDGRLFASQVFLGDALYEIDIKGAKAPRKIMENMGGLNGFEFGPDGLLYGPLWFKKQVVRIDVDKASLSVVADGFRTPAAVNFDSSGNLYVVDTAAGQVIKVDPATGKKEFLSKLKTSLDNLAFNSKDEMFVTNMADNGVQRVDAKSGRSSKLVQGRLSMPGGLAIARDGEEDRLYVADLFAFRSVNTQNGNVNDILRMHGDRLEYPFNVSVTQRHAYLSSWFTGTVQKVDRRTGRTIEAMHNFKAPMDVVDLPGSDILVAEFATGSLLKVGGKETERRDVLAKDLAGPVGLANKKVEAVYVTEALGGQVSEVALKDGAKRLLAKGLKSPEGIAVAPSGKLVVAEVGERRLIEIDPADGSIVVIAANLPIGLPAPAGVPPSFVPTGVAVGKDGVIYFSSDIENAIYRAVKVP